MNSPCNKKWKRKESFPRLELNESKRFPRKLCPKTMREERKKDFQLILNFNAPLKGRFSSFFSFSFSCSLCRLWKCSSPFCCLSSKTNSNCVKTDNLKLLMLEHERRILKERRKEKFFGKGKLFKRIFKQFPWNYLLACRSKSWQRRQQQTQVNINKKL